MSGSIPSGRSIENAKLGVIGETVVDHGALKANQLLIIALSLLAFILDLPALATGVALVMALGTWAGKPGFLPVYTRILRPLALIRPELIPDKPGPHRFAQGLGAFVLFGGSIAVLNSLPWVGWALVWLVIFLAGINVFAGFCVGCFMYYQLGRLGLPGFSRNHPEGSRPGFKSLGRKQ